MHCVDGLLHVEVRGVRRFRLSSGFLKPKTLPFVRLCLADVVYETPFGKPTSEEMISVHQIFEIPIRHFVEPRLSYSLGCVDKKDRQYLLGSWSLRFDKLAIEGRTSEGWLPVRRSDGRLIAEIHMRMFFTPSETEELQLEAAI
mmetsp:Transcript_34394/g.57675  ORF Transcript_34394/g.57675 Transcript_34394/m.57675 type:complete len:144 (+) Transcript_34394:110-541(+)